MDRKTDSEPTEDVSGADGVSRPLSHSETACALRTFIYTSGMWGACAFQLAFAAAPLLGSALARAFEPVHLEWFRFPVGNLLVPNLLPRPVEDARGTTPRQFLAQVGRVNLLSYVYGSLVVYDRASSTRTRARAVRRMGRSKSPMALDRLIKALEDASPEVRRQAAHGLGETRSTEAVTHLLYELADEESDIRSEAA